MAYTAEHAEGRDKDLRRSPTSPHKAGHERSARGSLWNCTSSSTNASLSQTGRGSRFQGQRPKAKKRLDDLDVWLQCFALYVAVLAPTKPALVPNLMAYMISIIRASQEYEASAWVAYDDAYRRQAAAAGDQWQWSQANPSLYAVCFTGKAKRTGRCERCLSAAHKTEDCSLLNEDDPDIIIVAVELSRAWGFRHASERYMEFSLSQMGTRMLTSYCRSNHHR